MGNTAEFLRRTAEGNVEGCQAPTCIDLERRFLFVFNEGIFNPRMGSFQWAGETVLAQFFWADLYRNNLTSKPSEKQLLLIKNPKLISTNPLDAGIGVVNALVLPSPATTFSASLIENGFILGRPIRKNVAGRIDYQEQFTGAMNRYIAQLSKPSIPTWAISY